MKDASEGLKAGASHGEVFAAGSQSSGRGRLPGRKWEDDGGGALLFTIILGKSEVSSGLPLTQLLALALCIHLEKSFDLSPALKWPNDVLIDGAKIAGILVETQGDFYLAGMGVNLFQRVFPNGLRRRATSIILAMEKSGGRQTQTISASEVLESILGEIYCILGAPPSSETLMGYLDSLNKPVSVLLGDPGRQLRVSGIVAGLAPDGALIIQSDAGERHFIYSGELEFPDV